MEASVHPTAIVDSGARLASGVRVGPYAVVGADVVVGEGSVLHSHAVVLGPSVIGRDNVFHSFSVVGGAPQYKGGDPAGEGRLVVGDRNVIREHATVHRGARGGTTRVGSDNLLMVGAHVAHDVALGSWVTMANGVQLAGHVVVSDHVTFGGQSGVAQHVHVGESAFVAAGAMCERDVPPFVIVQGDRARVRGLNLVGLRRRGVPEASIARLIAAHRRIFVSGIPRREATRSIERGDPYLDRLLDALAAAAR
jgi:UDP-N-acetylglucosamine acyltransferase